MLTQNDIDGFAAMAGDDFMWDGIKGGSRVPSTVRVPLRLDLIARQGGICFDCGNMLDDTAEFNHIVSRGPNNKGWHAGNIAVGHSVCNQRQQDRGPIVNMSDMSRPDVIAMEWTPFPILKRNR